MVLKWSNSCPQNVVKFIVFKTVNSSYNITRLRSIVSLSCSLRILSLLLLYCALSLSDLYYWLGEFFTLVSEFILTFSLLPLLPPSYWSTPRIYRLIYIIIFILPSPDHRTLPPWYTPDDTFVVRPLYIIIILEYLLVVFKPMIHISIYDCDECSLWLYIFCSIISALFSRVFPLFLFK